MNSNRPSLRIAFLGAIMVLVTSCAPVQKPFAGLDKLDLLVISDSSGWGIAEQLPPLVQEELGLPVSATDKAISNLTAVQALKAVRGESGGNMKLEGWHELVAEAEIILINASPAESESSNHPGDWECIYAPRYYAADCPAESFDQYQSDLQALVDEILALRGDRPTVIRFFSYWIRPDFLEADGVVKECTRCVETMIEAVAQAGAAYNIPLVNLMDALNGPQHTDLPTELGYIGEDGIHTSLAGQQRIASAIHALGYEPISPRASQ